jgi:MFS family permease
MLSFDVLRISNFRRLMFTRFFITFALQAQAVIVGWQIYSMTKDPLLLGLVGLAEAVPALLCSLVAGHFVDIGRPHIIYRLSITVLALNALFLLLVAGGYVGAAEAWIIPCLFAGVFASGLVRSFTMPCSFSMFSSYVPRRDLSAGAAWLNTGFQTAIVTGPAIAGLVYGVYGADAAWCLPVSALFLAVVLSLLLRPISRLDVEKREPAIQSIKNGWRFILNSPVILSVMALDMFAVLFGGAVAMLPAFADQILHVGPQGLGMLRAAPAVGSVFMALYLAVKPLRYLSGRVLLGAFIGFGVSMIGFGLSETFWISMLFLAFSGMFDSINVVMRSSIVQLLTPPDMKGRVSSVGSMFIISSNEIGAFQSGVAASLMGLVASVVFGGVASLGVVAAVAFFSPSLRRLVIDTHNDRR